MDPLSRAAIRLPEASNALVLRFAIVCVALLLPLSLNNFIQGRSLLGVLSLPIVGLFALNVHCIIRRGHYYTKITNQLLAPLTLLFLTACIVELGLKGALWSFPVVLSYYLLLPERNAWFANALLVVVATTLIYMAMDFAVAMRLLATLTIVSVTTAFLIHVIARQQKQLRVQAITDPLTGAYNAELLEPTLSHAILQSNRTSASMSIIAMDVEPLKLPGEYGRPARTDESLKMVAQLIKSKCQDTDRLFHVGEGTFVLLMRNACSDSAWKRACEIRDEIAGSRLQGDSSAVCEVGISTLQTSDSWREWIERGMTHLGQTSAQKKAAA